MPLKNDEIPAEPQSDLIFILAIAGRIDAQSRILARNLDKDRGIYYSYALFDSLNSSYSMFKYFFDMSLANNNPDFMHETMLTPGGIAAITAETIFLVSFSLLACHFDGEENNAVKKFIANAWPYFRDVMKGLKNAYKGGRSTIQAISHLSGANLSMLIVPVGLTLGLIAVANRLWLRDVLERRKIMMRLNAQYLLKIKGGDYSNKDEREVKIKDNIKYQKIDERIHAYFANTLGGLIDGLYLYVGVLGLAAFTPPVFIVMASLCAVYTFLCVVTRLYEEYDYQQRLIILQTKCKLALLTKEMESCYEQLFALLQQPSQSHQEKINTAYAELQQLIKELEEERQHLVESSTRSYFTAGLLGIKSGLYGYGALASILFLIGSFMIMASTPLPPVLLITAISLGLCIITGFFVHSMVKHHSHLKQQVEIADDSDDSLIKIKNQLANSKDSNTILEVAAFKSSLAKSITIKPSPQFFFQEWFEVIRSFFSGVGKGQKFVDFAGNGLQEPDADGHYHDTPLMHILSFFSSLFFSIALSFRALARGLGRPPLEQPAKTDDGQSVELVPIEEKESQSSQTEQPMVFKEATYHQTMSSLIESYPVQATSHKLSKSSLDANNTVDSPKPITRASSCHSFFAAKTSSSDHAEKILHSQSASSLKNMTIGPFEHKVLGLK